MNTRHKQVQLMHLNNEKKIIKELKKEYAEALAEINEKIKILQSDELTQAKIYQIQYQKSLKKQIEDVLNKLKSSNFNTIDSYLKNCYQEGFIGTLYDLQGQGIPLVFPMNQEKITNAIQVDSKISEGLYKRLGVNINKLKKNYC